MEYCYLIINVINNKENLLIFYSKEHIKLIKIIFHMTNSFIFAVRNKRHVDEIDLHFFKKTCNNNKFERVFEFIKSLAMIDFIQFNEEINLINKNIIIFVIDLNNNDILIDII